MENTELKKEYIVVFKRDKPSIYITKEMVYSLMESDSTSNLPSDFLWGDDGHEYLVLSKNEISYIAKWL